MNILVINAGSVTVKYKLFGPELKVLLSGQLDNKNGQYVSDLNKDGTDYSWLLTGAQFENAAALILNEVKDYTIDKIGFRIVHGGEKFVAPTLLDNKVLDELDRLNPLAPLHNPPTIKRIREFRALKPDLPMYGVFDTAFHSTMQQKAYMYGLPYEYYSHYGVRKYGFHGISHQYMTNLLHELEPNAKKLITCHLGGGASICAVRDGISIDTSMGFTPLEGLIMATRAGDVDDGAISYIQALTGFNDQQMEEIENKRSGLLGISGYTSDMRTLLSDAQAGNTRAGLAIDMYIYRIQKYIGSFAAALDGVHALAISGGVGSGSDVIRKRMLSGLDFLHLMVSDKINGGRINVAENLRISTDFSVPVWVIPANEELQIAKEIALL